MDLMKLKGNKFTYNEKILNIKEFRGLFNLDNTEDKRNFESDLLYIYWLVHPSSRSVKEGKSLEERHIDAVKHSGKDKDYQPTVAVNNAIEYYLTHVYGIYTNILNNLYRAFATSNNLISELDDRNRLVLEQDNLTDEELERAIKNQNMLLDLATNIPKKLKDLKVAVEMSKTELDEKEQGRGNTDITSSMKPSSRD